MLERLNTQLEVHRPARRARQILAKTIAASTAALRRQSPKALRGEAAAVHAMRIALTRLSTALLFFSPFLDSTSRKPLDRRIRWLAKRLGYVRDADVAIARGQPKEADRKMWIAYRISQSAQLEQALNSRRYQLLLESLHRESKCARQPRSSKAEYMPGDIVWAHLNRWVEKLATYRKKLDKLDNRKLHHLRLRAKRVRYAAELALADLTPRQAIICEKIAKHAKSIQQTLGNVADVRMYRRVAKHQQLPELPGFAKLERRKARRKAIHTAGHALGQLRRAIQYK